MKPFEHKNDEPEFLLANAKEIASDVKEWRAGNMTAKAFEEIWGYENPEHAALALIKAIAS